MKKITKILISILLVLSCILFLLYDAFFIEPKNIRIRKETLSSEKIPLSMDSIKIAFFSDLDIGSYTSSSQLEKVVDRINSSSADIVLFGGNLFSSSTTVDEDTQNTISQLLQQIKAPLGKFAVYGELDHASDELLSQVNMILNSSGFEVLENRSISLRNKTSDCISLVGIDNLINGTVDIDTAYSNVPRDNYVITLCNTPDTADRVPTDLTDYFLAGHSLGGQVYYLFSSSYSPSGAESHLRGKEKIDNSFTLDITSGVGCMNGESRLFSPSEVVIYTLNSTKEVPTPTSETEENSTTETAAPEETSVPETADPIETSAPEDTTQSE